MKSGKPQEDVLFLSSYRKEKGGEKEERGGRK